MLLQKTYLDRKSSLAKQRRGGYNSCNMADFNQDSNPTPSFPKIRTTKVVYPQIYSYTLPDERDNDGSQKIGYTEQRNVDKRILEQVNTPAKHHRYEKLWSAPAFFANSDKDFRDKDFHKFLDKSGVNNRRDLGTEWYYFNGTPEKSKQLFDNFRQYGFAALQTGDSKIPYELRSEQQDAVEKALEYFRAHEKGEFLWNAKPRFGKTLASYDLAKRLSATKVLIVTNRPAIANSWFDDYEKFIDGYYFVSSASSLSERKSLTREQFNAIDSTDKKIITFLSLQDLKGSKYFGGSHDKLAWIADLDWDLLVIDEAHEGIDTGRTDAAFDIVKRQHTLHLSGTPFKALANQKFSSDAIFNWTYLDEQKAKQAELDSPEGTGPHTDLPDLRLYTYRISQMISAEVNEGIEIEGESRDYAFDLNEFFATKNQRFVHEVDVKEFLRNLSTNSKYPFSTPELRDELRHTFWYVGNRVESVKALEQLLKQDEIFKDYKIVLAAGDGKSFDEEEEDFRGNEKSFDKVKKAIKENTKTITLSCGQLTTGVTIKEWSAVLMLTDIKTPAQYMQAAFRAQNPYRFTENDQLRAKKSAYLFDFAPTRVLEIYETFANGLNPKTANGEVTEAERKENVKKLLNFFPVISEDVEGKMVELDAEKVLTFPNALAATEIVQARFMTNLLFNDNVKGVFHFPREVEDILDKMDKETSKRVKKDNRKLDLDHVRKVEAAKKTKITENTGLILGEKIYGANIERIVDAALDQQTPEEIIDTLPQQVIAQAEPLITKTVETYHLTKPEADDLRAKSAEIIKVATESFVKSGEKDPAAFKQQLTAAIEHDVVEAKVAEQETKVVETIQKSKEEEVREHLRAFTRTIPMFVMANASRDKITIDNFDEQISDEDLIDLTNITKEEFHKLRDGFDYTTESGERKHFDGVFHKYKFNASIAEFVAEKDKRADYFDESIKDDIFELIPNQKNNQIFTPRTVVNMMVDGLEQEQPELFQRTDSTFIDLYMKSGMYITEIVKKLFANTRHNYGSDAECLKHILENQVYGLAPTGVLHGITSNYIFGFDTTHDIDMRNFKQHDLLPEAKDGTAVAKLAELYNRGEMMKFDAVVGNPPYQEEAKGDSTGDNPVYHLFLDSAHAIGSVAELITPARFLFNAGKTPKPWNQKILADKHLRVVKYESDASKIFSNTAITGGVVITLRDEKEKLGPIGKFFAFSELNTIVQKVSSSPSFKSIQNIISVQNKFNLSTLYQNHPEYRDVIGSEGNDKRVRANVFEKLSDIFHESSFDNSLRVLGLQNSKRTYRYVDCKYIDNPEWLYKWKLFVPESNGASGMLGDESARIISRPAVGKPGDGATQTFIVIGALDSGTEADSLEKYILSKFARVLLGALKVTQRNNSETWALVPLQDFTANSDIDWSKSIPEIDQQLNKKYGLSQEEIDFIETKVKSME